MKIKICFLILFLSGCAATPEKQSIAFDNKLIINHEVKAGMGDPRYMTIPEMINAGSGYYFATQSRKWTVQQLKQEYKDATGENLISIDSGSCKWDQACYQNAYLNAYKTKMKAFVSKVEEANKSEAESKNRIDEDTCKADRQCWTEHNVGLSTTDLQMQYAGFVSYNHNDENAADRVARQVCRGAGQAQRNGVSEVDLRKKMNVVEGLSPTNRQMLTDIASSCWTLSKFGVKDGTEKITIQ